MYVGANLDDCHRLDINHMLNFWVESKTCQSKIRGLPLMEKKIPLKNINP